MAVIDRREKKMSVKEWASARGYEIEDDEIVTDVEFKAKMVTDGCCELCVSTYLEKEVVISVEKDDGSASRTIWVTVYDDSVSLFSF